MREKIIYGFYVAPSKIFFVENPLIFWNLFQLEKKIEDKKIEQMEFSRDGQFLKRFDYFKGKNNVKNRYFITKIAHPLLVPYVFLHFIFSLAKDVFFFIHV